MRSLLFVPADSERKLLKGLESGADILILDLEDSVSPENKTAARTVAADFLRAQAGKKGPRLYIRVNDLSTGLTDDDLEGVLAARPEGIMLPKANSATDVTQLSAMLRVHEAATGIADSATQIIALVTETAQAVLNAGTYEHREPRLAGLTWGAEDLSAAIGARSARDGQGHYTDVFRLARAVTILAAASANVPAIDTVFTNFRDEAALKKECEEAERDGFTAKMAIHPAQVSVINAAFTPSQEAVERSRAVVAAFHAAGNPGVVGIDGKMYDRPHLRLAERLLERAKAAGAA